MKKLIVSALFLSLFSGSLIASNGIKKTSIKLDKVFTIFKLKKPNIKVKYCTNISYQICDQTGEVYTLSGTVCSPSESTFYREVDKQMESCDK